MDTLPETTGNQTVAQENTAPLDAPPIAPQDLDVAQVLNNNLSEEDLLGQNLNNSKSKLPYSS